MSDKKKAAKKANGKPNKGSGNGGKSKGKKSKKNGGKTRFKTYVFNEEVLENAYYTCHNVMDVLYCRGFQWPEAQKKKKKGKRR